MMALNLRGRRFGKLIVLRPSRLRRRGNGAYWLCLCDCGNKTRVKAYDLSIGKSKSCGCRRFEANALPAGEAAFRLKLREYEGNAKARGINFALPKEEFRFIGSRNCHYCGAEPKPVFARGCGGRLGIGTSFFWTGIDRRDNLKGYTPENSVACCPLCNYMKRGLGESEFLAQVGKILSHRRTQ